MVGEEMENAQGMRFVRIRAGSFLMGSPENEPGRYEDETLHRVTLTRDFHLQTTPVTVGQWRRFSQSSGYLTQAEREGGACGPLGSALHAESSWGISPRFTWRTPGFAQQDDHPVTCVSMHDIEAFIDWLNTGEKEANHRYRLPTEAEWEYACRAGSTTIFAFGDCLSIDDANFNDSLHPLPGCGNSGVYLQKTIPVGKTKANHWGLLGMHGNVVERCADLCDWDAEKGMLICDTYRDDIRDPLSSKGTVHIARGGGWSADARHCRSACRIKYAPDERWTFLGFRLVLERDDG